MLLVKTTLGVSAIQGIGIFAGEFIPAGTVTWKYHPVFDLSFTEDQIAILSEPARERFLNYTYYDEGLEKYVLCFDDLRFINHCSNNPNILSKPHVDIAARDIHAGEELLCDYTHFEPNYFVRRGIDPSKFK